MTSDHDDAPTRLVLVRHGESNVTVDRVIGGFRTCSGLSELGRMQAIRLRDRLLESGELRGGLLVASNFERAIETARVIAPAVVADDRDGAVDGVDLVIDPAFGEHDPGPELDGMSFSAYVDRFGVPVWDGDPHHEVFPGGETLAEFHLRVGAGLSRLLAAHPGRLVVVSCHGGVVDAVFRHLLRTPASGGFDLWTLNTSITEFVLAAGERRSDRPRWRLARYNDAAHLLGLPGATPRSGAGTGTEDG